MYNETFSMLVTAVDPYDDPKKGTTGILLTGVHSAQEVAWLDDAGIPPERRRGLDHYVAGAIPARGPISLLFSPREGVVLQAMGLHLGCVVKKIRVGELNDAAVVPVKLTIDIPEVNEKSAGVLVAKLGHQMELHLEAKQEELGLGSTKGGQQETPGRAKITKLPRGKGRPTRKH